MNRFYKAVIVASALGVATVSSAFAGPVEDRKELMKSVVKSVKLAVPMAKGETPFDAAAAAAAMQTINDAAGKFVKLFPEGSGTHPKTEALPKIWQNMNDFKAKAADLQAASAKTKAAAGQGQEAFKAAVFGSLVKTCKACHDTYRIKKN
jgi:cytochrome c556